MNVHKNARMTPRGRAHLVQQTAVCGLTPAAAAQSAAARRVAYRLIDLGCDCLPTRLIGRCVSTALCQR